ncbi:DUF3089 domain-containing protein [Sandarakinorhabdus sp.]|uniref:DUF3089 domain-containing protein n=1 Tax=Sandarakinorhabdus sp. TaxID=1916663 RepID=UPI00286EA6C0|nr:DUF3089 domain-containing protein [Sandarakinorhabdus sp.]
MPARRFLWVITILVMIVIAAIFAYRLFGDRLIRLALVPGVPYAAPAASRPDYADAAQWLARPDLSADDARWLPPGAPALAAPPLSGQRAAVFYVLPTAVFDRDRWNGDLDAPANRPRVQLFLRSQASIFTAIGDVWSPKYRQAVFGAFLTDKPEAEKALGLAYGDVLAAFDRFIADQPKDRPIVLAGHSQGALHLLRLMRERVAGMPLAARIVAVYAVGWPISVTADLPALGLPACAAPAQTGCILTWQSYASPADNSVVRATFDATTGLAGLPRRGTAMLCTNPLLGRTGPDAAPAAANRGSMVPSADFKSATLVAGGIGARCTAAGILDIGPPPGGYPGYVLPGNNYHVYDFPLFWADLRSDAARRMAAWKPAITAPR